MRRNLGNIAGLVLTWAVWLWLATQELATTIYLIVAVGGALAAIPLIFLGRWLLDKEPTVHRAERVTAWIHYALAILLGSAILTATRLGMESPTWPISLPSWVGITLMSISGLGLLLVIFTLVLKGLGAPFAIALTRVVVTDWIYAWTRNPMVISALAFLVGLGLWLQSGLFLVWILAVVSPVMLVFLTIYEERELEIRFGEDYRNYKASTPRFLPRRPLK
jgi:protein-S-isoprenylcysteine O-methyltransferase Ste14